jgi:hypothetical protein
MKINFTFLTTHRRIYKDGHVDRHSVYEGGHKNWPKDTLGIFCVHLRAVRHDVPRAVSKPVSKPVLAPACNRVLRTSIENIAIQPMRPAAPARSGAQGRCERMFLLLPSRPEPSLGDGAPGIQARRDIARRLGGREGERTQDATL